MTNQPPTARGPRPKHATQSTPRRTARLHRTFNRFRRTEAGAIITNTIAMGLIVCLALAVFFAVRPSYIAARAQSLAAAGKSEQALRLLRTLQTEGYPEEKLEAVREGMAEGFLRAGCQAQAASLLSELTDPDRRAALERESAYLQALADYQSGRYAAAAQAFYQLADYRDGAARYADCRCALAIEACLNGNESAARSLLVDTPEAAAHIADAALKVTGNQADADAVLANPLFDPDNLTRLQRSMADLDQAREDRPRGQIAAGAAHTVALRSDGTVLATGDNTSGQCAVAEWTQITAVAAGAAHTVGLRADGTVLATGDNTSGQCDTGDWQDIVAIAAASYATIGLKADGTVVACGLHAEATAGWHNVTCVTGGSYSLGCLYDQGAMLCTHKGAQLDMSVTLTDLSVCGQVSAGITREGTMVCSSDQAPTWQDMLTVTVCESGIIGINAQGEVLYYDWRKGETETPDIPGTAVAVESSGRHHVVLTADGRVWALGANESGQCDTAQW